MGMFDYVKYEAPCTACGEPMTEWQSKSGECSLQELTPQELFAQSDAYGCNFYNWCEKCKAYHEYQVTATEPLPPIKVELVKP